MTNGNVGGGQGRVEKLQAELTDLRTRADEMLVQLDLAGMELREEIGVQLERIENSALAIRSGIRYAGKDLGTSTPVGVEGIRSALRDLEYAFEEARSALGRDEN